MRLRRSGRSQAREGSSMTRFQWNINEKQGKLIEQALDFYARCRAGQLRVIREECGTVRGKDIDAWLASDPLIEALTRMLFPDLPRGAGDFNYEGGKELMNLRQSLRHGLNWQLNPPEPGRMLTTSLDEPITSWWDDPKEAAILHVYEGQEAVRIRDQADRTTRLAPDLEAILGTSDLKQAEAILKEWKEIVDKHYSPD